MIRSKLRVVALIFLVAQGCSIFLEANRPAYRNVQLLQVGAPRSEITDEFGPPVQSYEAGGKQTDIYLIDTHGRHLATKAALMGFNLAADTMTAGLWEAVGTPAEKYTQHKLTRYVITYTGDDRVESVRLAGGQDVPALALAAEPAVTVGEVAAIYLRVKNLTPDILKCSVPQAILSTGGTAGALSLASAIAAAGDDKHLAESLSHLAPAAESLPAAMFIPGTRMNEDSLGLMGPVALLMPEGEVANLVLSTSYAFDPARFRLGNSELCDPAESSLPSGEERSGYVFFPKK